VFRNAKPVFSHSVFAFSQFPFFVIALLSPVCLGPPSCSAQRRGEFSNDGGCLPSLKRPVELGADWEIRFGPDNRFRVFYAVEREHRKVLILAVGVKQRNRLVIGGEEVDL
jgi:hypothetical protein